MSRLPSAVVVTFWSSLVLSIGLTQLALSRYFAALYRNTLLGFDLPALIQSKESSTINGTASAMESSDTFSACLLTMDDSHRLIEWLAYHYHTLPLRRLIVTVDPRSITSPSHLFERWRKHGMEITEWSDENLDITREFAQQEIAKKNGLLMLHRRRQLRFYKRCMETLQTENRTWTLLADADEFLAFNTHTMNLNHTVEEPASVMTFLKEESSKNDTTLQQSSCISIPRLRYGSNESRPEQVKRDVPPGFNGSSLLTMRFRKHAPLKSFAINRLVKTIVDVSRVGIILGNVHNPVNSCNKKLQRIQTPRSPLVIRHYSGTYEQYTFRSGDARGAVEIGSYWEGLKMLDFGEDDGIRPWLKGFVDDVGADVAAELLDGAGDISQGRPLNNTVVGPSTS